MNNTHEGRTTALREAVARGDRLTVARLLQPASEEERLALRRELVKELQARAKELRASLRFPSFRGIEDPKEIRRLSDEWRKGHDERAASLSACRLAIAGIGTQREAEAALLGGRQEPDWQEY
jgi:hypothetical protein